MGLEGGELLAVPQASRIIARAILLPIAFGDEEIHRRASSTKAPESGSSTPSRIPVWSEAGIPGEVGVEAGCGTSAPWYNASLCCPTRDRSSGYMGAEVAHILRLPKPFPGGAGARTKLKCPVWP